MAELAKVFISVEAVIDVAALNRSLAAAARQIQAQLAAALAGAGGAAAASAASTAAAAAATGALGGAATRTAAELAALAQAEAAATAAAAALAGANAGAAGSLGALGDAAVAASNGLTALAGGPMALVIHGVEDLIKKVLLADAVIAGFGIAAAANFERVVTSLELVSPAGTNIEKLTADIEALAETSTFSFATAATAVQRFLASGVGENADEALVAVTALSGAIATVGGGNLQLQRIALALSQIQSKGKLAAAELRQIAESLPNFDQGLLFEKLSIAIGQTVRSSDDLRKVTVDADTATKAIIETFQDLPGAAEALARQNDTLIGQFAEMKDKITLALALGFTPLSNELRDRLGPLTEDLIGGLSDLIPGIIELGSNFLDLAEDVLPIVIEGLKRANDVLNAFFDDAERIGGFIRFIRDIPKNINDVLPDVDLDIGDLDRDIEDFFTIITHGTDVVKDFNDELEKVTTVSPDFIFTSGNLARFVGNTEKANKAAKKLAEEGAAALEVFGDAFKDILGDSEALADAQGALADSTKDVAEAQAKLNELLAEGGAKERAKNVRDLADAENAVRDAIRGRTKAQRDLDKLTPALFDREAVDAADAVTLAQLAVADAIRERDGAQKKLNQTNEEGQGTDLAGLSIDQVNSRLASARATAAALASQQQTTGETQAELQEDALKAEIALRKAQQELADAQNTQAGLAQTQAERLADATERRDIAERSIIEAREDQLEAAGKLEAFDRGSSKFAEERAAAEERVKAARDKEAEAVDLVALAQAKIKDDLNEQLGVELLITNEQAKQLALLRARGALSPLLERSLLEPVIRALQGPNAAFGPLAITDATIAAIFDRLTQPGADLAEILKNLKVPGFFKQGGLVFDKTLLWAGEGGRAEAILPLQDPDRALKVLRDAVPFMAGGLRGAMADALGGGTRSAVGAARASVDSRSLLAQQQNNELLATLQRIEAKIGSGGNNIDVNVTQSIPNHDVYELAAALERRISDRLR